jgi:formaldehyde-activating enzyme involved in methanogenesis
MALDLQQQRQYIADLDISGLPRPIVAQDAATDAGEVFDKAKEQARVVGSGVFSFAVGVDEEVRGAISDSALLAQLFANKKVDSEKDPIGWFKVYSEVLQNVGWTLQDKSWDDYTSRGDAAEVHAKIIEVMTAALAPSPATLLILAATVRALQAQDDKSSWLKIFSRETQKARMARFQIGLVETGEHGDVFVSLLACVVEAANTFTHVLLFNYRTAKATFKARTDKVSINRGSLTDLHADIVKQTRVYQSSFLSSIKDLPPPPTEG